jgi:hypothetical protein
LGDDTAEGDLLNDPNSDCPVDREASQDHNETTPQGEAWELLKERRDTVEYGIRAPCLVGFPYSRSPVTGCLSVLEQQLELAL